VSAHEMQTKQVVETSPNERFVRYRDIIGRGAAKIVYRGYDRDAGKEVAWYKVHLDHIELTKRVETEIKKEFDMLTRINSPYVLKLIAFWFDSHEYDKVDVICELFYVGSLKSFIRANGLPSDRLIRRWGRQILLGVQYLHCEAAETPIIHRNLKCDNVFIHGHTGRVKIGDLGSATISAIDGPMMSIVGTPNFMAPEVFDGHYDETVDIYAFGLCLCEMAMGSEPYNECKSHAQIYKRIMMGEPPESAAGIANEELAQIIMRCLGSRAARPSVNELLSHDYFASDEIEISPRSEDIPENWEDRL
jgi:WNK lysine deficient protein kinase